MQRIVISMSRPRRRRCHTDDYYLKIGIAVLPVASIHASTYCAIIVDVTI